MGNQDEAGVFESAKTTRPEKDVLSAREIAVLTRKVDLRVLPMLFLVLLIAFLDRRAAEYRTRHIFIPYILFEIPSNVLMKRFTPRTWLSLCVLGFGIVELAQGFVQNFSGLLAARFFLGFFEAGVFPGSFYLISFWYKREEAQKRFTGYFCSVTLASAFGGLLASAITGLDGVGGKSNWRWIFILEGIFTILVGAAAFFFVVDFPSDAKWLSEAERKFVLSKSQKNEVGLEEIVTMKDLAVFFRDPKNYLGAFMYFSVVVPVYSFAYFTPTIVKTLGFPVVQTQLHSVPPFAAALGLCIFFAYLSDLTDLRLPYVLFSETLIIIGLVILVTTPDIFSAQYGGIFLVCMGASTTAPIVICWYVMNLQGHKERIIGSGWMISFGNTGGILATFAFLPSSAPHYLPGYSVCLGVGVLGIIATICYALLVVKQKAKIQSDSGAKNVHVMSL